MKGGLADAAVVRVLTVVGVRKGGLADVIVARVLAAVRKGGVAW